MIIAIDYDGTIIEDGHWPDHGPVLPGAEDALKAMIDDGHTIIIHTCRTAPVMPDGTQRTLLDQWNELVAIDSVLKSMGLGWLKIHTDPWKPDADLYVDNKAIGFRGCWGHTLQSVRLMAWRDEVEKRNATDEQLSLF